MLVLQSYFVGRYIISGKHRTWETARKKCKAAGLHLASVRNQAEINEIVEVSLFDPELLFPEKILCSMDFFPMQSDYIAF